MRALSLQSLSILCAFLMLIGLTGCSFRCTVQECCPRPCAGTSASRIGIDIPDAVHAGVLRAMPGFVASEFEVESKDGKQVYEFEGRWNGKNYEIVVDGQGNVLQIDEEVADDDEIMDPEEVDESDDKD